MRRLAATVGGAATAAALSLLAAGCGGESSPGSGGVASVNTPSSAAQSHVAGALRFTNCMRSNGVTNYPEPTSNGRQQSLSQIDPYSATFLTAYKVCQRLASSGEVGPPAPSAAELRFALTFAQCMHKHGFPQFPAPLTTYGPGLTLGRGEYFPPVSTSEIQSPAFTRAAKACGVQLPSGPP